MTPAIHIDMPITDAEQLAATTPLDEHTRDQLWLQAILIAQRKRINRDERHTYNTRADRILNQLASSSTEPKRTR
jgi:hypothetical protein